jgi:multidrug efflux pump subunit AcrA (membrane-fusion protein)
VQRYNVVARVTAFLDEVVFKEGQEVKEGDVLYRLEQSRFEADVEAKQGAIAVHGSVEISSQMKPIEAAADPGAPPRRTG